MQTISVEKQKDTHQWQLPRFGIITVDNDPTPEMEIWQSGVSLATIHTTRFHLPRPQGTVYQGSSVKDLAHCGLETAVTSLQAIGVDAICLCFTSSSIFSDGEFDTEFVRYVASLGPCTKVNTSARSLVEGLQRRGITSPAMVVPPWFSPETVSALGDYFSRHSINVATQVAYDLGEGWSDIPRQDRFDRGAVWEITEEALFSQIDAAISFSPTPVDAVIVPGSGFPSLHVKNRVEKNLGVPLLSVNQASLEWCISAVTPDMRE